MSNLTKYQEIQADLASATAIVNKLYKLIKEQSYFINSTTTITHKSITSNYTYAISVINSMAVAREPLNLGIEALLDKKTAIIELYHQVAEYRQWDEYQKELNDLAYNVHSLLSDTEKIKLLTLFMPLKPDTLSV